MIGYSLTFSKIILPSIKKIQVSASFLPLRAKTSVSPYPSNIVVYFLPLFLPNRKESYASYPKQSFAAPHTCSDNGSVKQAK
jgi:hypothetical protein